MARKSTWQLQEAKNKLSEVIRRAREEGPQTITVRGEPAAVVTAPRESTTDGGSPSASTLRRLAKRWGPIFDSLPELELPARESDSELYEFEEDEGE